MQKFILAAVVAVACAGSVSAAQLSAGNQSKAMRLYPAGDYSNLTSSQVAQINMLFSNSTNLRSGNNPRGKLKAILAQN